MAQAKPILSSKREAERLRERYRAQFVLARGQAKKAVEQRIRAEGRRLISYSFRELAQLTDDFFEQHKAELLANARHVIDTWSGFAYLRCAKVETNAQQSQPCSDSTISVQIS